jgi:hypothetical protein
MQVGVPRQLLQFMRRARSVFASPAAFSLFFPGKLSIKAARKDAGNFF